MQFLDIVDQVAPKHLPLLKKVIHLDRLVSALLLRQSSFDWQVNHRKQNLYVGLLSSCSFFYFSSQSGQYADSILHKASQTWIDNWLSLDGLDLLTIELDQYEQHLALLDYPNLYNEYLSDYLTRVRPHLLAIVVKAHSLENSIFANQLNTRHVPSS